MAAGAEAKKFADMGQWGKAAEQYHLGGGQGFTQPQYEAFIQQYGNVGSPAGQLGQTFGDIRPHVLMPGDKYWGPEIIADGPGSGMWGPPGQIQPIGKYISDDHWGPPPETKPITPPQAQPIAPPQAQPIGPPIAKPMPPQAKPGPPPSYAPSLPMPTNPNWSSYVQGNPDLLAAYNRGSPQSIGDWGKSHWDRYGQHESRAVNPYSGLLDIG